MLLRLSLVFVGGLMLVNCSSLGGNSGLFMQASTSNSPILLAADMPPPKAKAETKAKAVPPPIPRPRPAQPVEVPPPLPPPLTPPPSPHHWYDHLKFWQK